MKNLQSALAEARSRFEIPGLAAGILRHDGTQEVGFTGVGNLTTGEPLSESTRFQLASVSKPIVATLFVRLSETGLIDLDESLETAGFSTSIPNQAQITLRHLLSHTAGLSEIDDLLDDQRDYQTAELLSIIPLVKPEFSPGEGWSYSNVGYDLLGMWLEHRFGCPYGEVLSEYLFDPLDMTNAFVSPNVAPAQAVSTGYDFVRGRIGPMPKIAPSLNALASGGIWASVPDLLNWLRGLTAGTYLTEAGLAEMWMESFHPSGSRNGYGLGWVIGEHHGRKMVSHEGQWQGFSTAILHFPARQSSFVLLANRDELPALELAYRIFVELL